MWGIRKHAAFFNHSSLVHTQRLIVHQARETYSFLLFVLYIVFFLLKLESFGKTEFNKNQIYLVSINFVINFVHHIRKGTFSSYILCYDRLLTENCKFCSNFERTNHTSLNLFEICFVDITDRRIFTINISIRAYNLLVKKKSTKSI